VKVYIGDDSREQAAVEVAESSLKRTSGLDAERLNADRLRDAGLLWRLGDHRGAQCYDLVSNAPMSTAFAVSRFLTPLLCQGGYALFVDCDVVFVRDVREMLGEIEPGKAVYVVKHDYSPAAGVKMNNQSQTRYPRKNWSSVCLWNVDHPAIRRLSLHDVNTRPGRDLHAFYFLHDDEIGSLDPAWNWLVDEQPRPFRLGIAHFTLGTPNTPGHEGSAHAALWFDALYNEGSA
jgi:hypothetical protein